MLGHCLQIIALSKLRLTSSATESEAYRWKMQALVRLHIGVVLFLCMRVVAGKPRQGIAGIRRSLHPAVESFSLWYTCVFHPLVEWEQKSNRAATPLRDICGFGRNDSDFLCAGGFGALSNPFAEDAVHELLRRIATLAETYSFVLDPSRARMRGGGSEYFASCGIEELLSMFTGPRIQWVPACMLFGVKGHHLLRRLETSSRVSRLFRTSPFSCVASHTFPVRRSGSSRSAEQGQSWSNTFKAPWAPRHIGGVGSMSRFIRKHKQGSVFFLVIFFKNFFGKGGSAPSQQV